MRKNVLVITEDMVLREKIKKEFQGNTIEIYHAISSETALKMYMMRTYCLVIMDIFIRESDGLELLKTIRHLKPVPILVLASKEDNKEKLRALKAGAACYFSPPYCWEECLVYANFLMDLYVDLQEKEVEGPLTFGTDLVIDLLGHQALLRGVNLKLTRLEKARRASIYRTDTKKKNVEIKGKYSSKYVLSDIMVCAECGQPYRRQVWSKYGAKRAVWRCDNRLKHGSKRCKHSPTLKEEILHEAIMVAVNSVVEDQGEFVQAFRENVIRIIGSYSATAEPTEYDSRIEKLQKKMMKLIEDSAKAESADEVFDKEYRIIADEIKELKKKKTKVVRERQLAESYDQRMQDMESYMRKTNYLKKEFDDDLVRRLLRAVRVINESKIEIQFQSGIVMTQRIDFED